MKRAVIANFYPIWPPIGGGQRRIFFLARELSKSFDVDIITPDWGGVSKTTTFSPHLREIRVGVEAQFHRRASEVLASSKVLSDVAYVMHWDECVLYNEVLTKVLVSADVAATAHPYSIYPLLRGRGERDMPIIFDSQNVELKQKSSVLEPDSKLLEVVRGVETAALKSSDHVIACSRNDALDFEKEYGIDASTVTIIENGVDALGVPVVPEPVLDDMREKLGLTSRLVAVFAGSYHHPNFQAAERILDIAERVPGIQFVLMGGVCNHEAVKKNVLRNVLALGEVDESTKWMLFRLADIGLNPMELGSGTNIKMFEYAAAGLVVLSSPFGARGIELEPVREFMVCEIEDMASRLKSLTVNDRADLQAIGDAARRKVTEVADWSAIGKRYVDCFETVLTEFHAKQALKALESAQS